MELEKAIEIIEKHIAIDKLYRKREDSDYDKFCDEQVEAMQTLLNELERLKTENNLAKETIKNHCADMDKVNDKLAKLQEENKEYERVLDIFDERKYRKKYLEEERAKRPNLLYPDADEIYKKYYALKIENENITRELLSRTDKLNDSIPKQVIRDKIEFYKRYGKVQNSDEYVMSVEIFVLEEILGEEK